MHSLSGLKLEQAKKFMQCLILATMIHIDYFIKYMVTLYFVHLVTFGLLGVYMTLQQWCGPIILIFSFSQIWWSSGIFWHLQEIPWKARWTYCRNVFAGSHCWICYSVLGVNEQLSLQFRSIHPRWVSWFCSILWARLTKKPWESQTYVQIVQICGSRDGAVVRALVSHQCGLG